MECSLPLTWEAPGSKQGRGDKTVVLFSLGKFFGRNFQRGCGPSQSAFIQEINTSEVLKINQMINIIEMVTTADLLMIIYIVQLIYCSWLTLLFGAVSSFRNKTKIHVSRRKTSCSGSEQCLAWL